MGHADLVDRVFKVQAEADAEDQPIRLWPLRLRADRTGCNRSARTMPDTLTIVVPDAMLRAALATTLVDLGHRLKAVVGQPVTSLSLQDARMVSHRWPLQPTAATCQP
jgi:hypothetical protein